MIPPYYTQYPLENGTFDGNEEPSNWYKKMYGVTTTWQIMFNTESISFRTEGDLSSVDRVNGIQGDAGREAKGAFQGGWSASGINVLNTDEVAGLLNATTGATKLYAVTYKLSRAYITANEFRVRNRLIRVYKLLSINGVSVEKILQGA